MENYYEILGLEQGATHEEIRAAYVELAKFYHPDRLAEFPDRVRKSAEDKLKDINKAYGILSNPVKQKEYNYNNKNYYETLGIDQNASFDEIESVYLELLKYYDIDVLSSFPEQESHSLKSKVNAIHEAYQTLSNPVNRAEYDSIFSSTRDRKTQPPQTASTTDNRNQNSKKRKKL